ncbi:MAG: hypothetical protein K6E17_04910 [Clostridiales bacterium]|nr:hypothetical protein [Clostridiales bacterium]
MNDALFAAREKLKTVTPLKRDCGKICGARCCRSLDGEETGMLLFPGEEEEYRGRPGWKVLDTERGPLAVCPGTCERDGRPLACRMFPLLPVIREAGTAAETDLRAGTVCPLARQGIRAMDPAFVEAVKEAGALLAADPAQRAFLERLAAEQEELRQMKREWRGKHV